MMCFDDIDCFGFGRAFVDEFHETLSRYYMLYYAYVCLCANARDLLQNIYSSTSTSNIPFADAARESSPVAHTA